VQHLSLDRIAYSNGKYADINNEFPNGPQIVYNELQASEFHHHRLDQWITARLVDNYRYRRRKIGRQPTR
jgi:hypothetical protein